MSGSYRNDRSKNRHRQGSMADRSTRQNDRRYRSSSRSRDQHRGFKDRQIRDDEESFFDLDDRENLRSATISSSSMKTRKWSNRNRVNDEVDEDTTPTDLNFDSRDRQYSESRRMDERRHHSQHERSEHYHKSRRDDRGDDRSVGRRDQSGSTDWIFRLVTEPDITQEFVRDGSFFASTVTTHDRKPYVLAHFNKVAEVDGVVHVTETAAMLLVKMSQTGRSELSKKLWTYDGTRDDLQYADLSVGGDENIYMLSDFTGEIVLNNGPTLNEDDGTLLVAKADSEGTIVWNVQILGALTSTSNITLDSDNNIYVVGTFQGSVRVGPLGSIFSSSGLVSDMFVAKIDSNGTPKWILQAVGTDLINGCGITYNRRHNNIVISGNYTSDITVDDFTLNSSGARASGYILTITTEGRALSLVGIENSSIPLTPASDSDELIPLIRQYVTFQCVVDDASGDVFLVGEIAGSFIFGSSILTTTQPAFFVTKLSGTIISSETRTMSTSPWLWARMIEVDDSRSSDFIVHVTTDSSNNAYVGFHAIGDVKLLNSRGRPVIVSRGSGSLDLSISKINSRGQWEWISYFPGTITNRSNQLAAESVDLYVVGNHCLDSSQGRRVEAFIAKVIQ